MSEAELTPEREQLIAEARQAIADTWTDANALVTHIAAVIETATGVRLPTGRPSIMDASREQLMAADHRAQHVTAALDIVLRQWAWGDARTLGELMPDLPEGVRERIVDNFVKAGIS
ncbi:hypothetical protein [Streptomyces sp. NPDC002599]|uniref:hypothetical protein n=1 Tax=Streptomyces sp. NPDC002599 TaxID=3154421 RepID=UPI003328EAEA